MQVPRQPEDHRQALGSVGCRACRVLSASDPARSWRVAAYSWSSVADRYVPALADCTAASRTPPGRHQGADLYRPTRTAAALLLGVPDRLVEVTHDRIIGRFVRDETTL